MEEPPERAVECGDGIVVMAAVEIGDEANPTTVSQKATLEIVKLARQLMVDTVVLHSIAHVFTSLAKPEIAQDVLQNIE